MKSKNLKHKSKQKNDPRIVVVGGGTGSFTVLSGLKKYPLELTAIVAMADDGGSTGTLRDELGVLPPGDVRQCLVALSHSPQLLRELMNYRFDGGALRGHSFGNLFLSALEKMTGSFDRAVAIAGDVLHIHGAVIPATLSRVRLAAKLQNGRIVRGQSNIHATNLRKLEAMFLEPRAKANPKAITAIRAADAIVIGPGDLYSSLIPTLLVQGIPEAISKSQARLIYNCNLMTKQEHTQEFTVSDYVRVIESYLTRPLDFVIYNSKRPSQTLLSRYAHEGEYPVMPGGKLPERKYVGGNLISRAIIPTAKGDPLAGHRTLIRHDPDVLARLIIKLL